MKHLLTFLLIFTICFGASAQQKKRGSSEFHYNKALNYFNSGEYEQALASTKDAMRTKRNEPKILLLQADIYEAQSKKDRAIDALQKASRIGSEAADQRLTDMGQPTWKALEKTEIENFEKDLENYLYKNEQETKPKVKKEKKSKKTKTR